MVSELSNPRPISQPDNSFWNLMADSVEFQDRWRNQVFLLPSSPGLELTRSNSWSENQSIVSCEAEGDQWEKFPTIPLLPPSTESSTDNRLTSEDDSLIHAKDLPDFYGDNPSQWLQVWNRCFDQRGITDWKEKMWEVEWYLQGRALVWFNSFEEKRESRYSWEIFSESLIHEFGSTDTMKMNKLGESGMENEVSSTIVVDSSLESVKSSEGGKSLEELLAGDFAVLNHIDDLVNLDMIKDDIVKSEDDESLSSDDENSDHVDKFLDVDIVDSVNISSLDTTKVKLDSICVDFITDNTVVPVNHILKNFGACRCNSTVCVNGSFNSGISLAELLNYNEDHTLVKLNEGVDDNCLISEGNQHHTFIIEPGAEIDREKLYENSVFSVDMGSELDDYSFKEVDDLDLVNDSVLDDMGVKDVVLGEKVIVDSMIMHDTETDSMSSYENDYGTMHLVGDSCFINSISHFTLILFDPGGIRSMCGTINAIIPRSIVGDYLMILDSIVNSRIKRICEYVFADDVDCAYATTVDKDLFSKVFDGAGLGDLIANDVQAREKTIFDSPFIHDPDGISSISGIKSIGVSNIDDMNRIVVHIENPIKMVTVVIVVDHFVENLVCVNGFKGWTNHTIGRTGVNLVIVFKEGTKEFVEKLVWNGEMRSILNFKSESYCCSVEVLIVSCIDLTLCFADVGKCTDCATNIPQYRWMIGETWEQLYCFIRVPQCFLFLEDKVIPGTDGYVKAEQHGSEVEYYFSFTSCLTLDVSSVLGNVNILCLDTVYFKIMENEPSPEATHIFNMLERNLFIVGNLFGVDIFKGVDCKFTLASSLDKWLPDKDHGEKVRRDSWVFVIEKCRQRDNLNSFESNVVPETNEESFVIKQGALRMVGQIIQDLKTQSWKYSSELQDNGGQHHFIA